MSYNKDKLSTLRVNFVILICVGCSTYANGKNKTSYLDHVPITFIQAHDKMLEFVQGGNSYCDGVWSHD
jgi:hypothetical protein